MGKGRLKEALEHAGSEHRYQHILVGLLMCAWISMVFVFLSSPFIYMDPLFNCSSSGSKTVSEKSACKKIDECFVIDDFTLVAENALYCGKNWARVTIQSIFPLGSFIGLLVMNFISDTRGRRQAFLGALGTSIVAVLLTLIGGKSGNIMYLIIAQFLGGFASYSIMPLAYTLVSDFLSDEYRPKAIVMLNSSGGIATIMLGLFYLIKLNWLYFVIIFQLIPFVSLFIAFYWFLEESPFILMNHNEVELAEEVYYRIAKWNGREENNKDIKFIIEDELERDKTQQPSFDNVIRTLKDWRFLSMIILLTTVNSIANLNYFGMSYSFSKVGLGYGYNSMVMGGVQLFSIFVLCNFLLYSSAWTASKVPRRLGIAGFYALTMLVELLYFTKFVEENLFISTFLIGVARMCALNGYCLIACCETEAFVVSIQSTAAGLIEGLGIIGGIIAPMIVEFAEKIDADPIAMCAICVSMAIWPAYFMRETLNVPQIELWISSKSLRMSLLAQEREMASSLNRSLIAQDIETETPLNKSLLMPQDREMETITTENSKEKIDFNFKKEKN